MGITRKTASIAIASVLAVGVVVPTVASAAKKSHKVKVVQTAKLTGIKLTGTTTGTFGKCKVTGTVTPPKVTAKYKCKGGTITFKTTDAKVIGANFVSHAKLSGTGKYKGITGTLLGKGSTGGGPSTFTGTAKY